MENQLRRYFAGLVGFAFVACWATGGLLMAVLATGACIAAVNGPTLLANRRQAQSRAVRPRPVRTRPLREEMPEGLPLVPDEPSLIIEFG
ncbi:MAG: hypothetical protein ACJ768_22650 [Gaiellaceae bacterium]